MTVRELFKNDYPRFLYNMFLNYEGYIHDNLSQMQLRKKAIKLAVGCYSDYCGTKIC